jgi:hypothetical protein
MRRLTEEQIHKVIRETRYASSDSAIRSRRPGQKGPADADKHRPFTQMAQTPSTVCIKRKPLPIK